MTSSVETAEYTNESRAATSGRLARSASRPDPLVPCGSIHIAPTPVPAPAPATTAARRFLATVLFVDMVDSTRRAVELGDSGWLDLQEAHEAMLRPR
jgi:class 3 adenylate cyclase